MRLRKSDLVSALVNLVVNACEAMPDGGRITLRTGGIDGQPWVEVQDDGPGMPPGIRNGVGERFYTSKESGTGLGLAIVSDFVKRNGARWPSSPSPAVGRESG